uniref:NADH dehydrogenase [ubiquinone] iron-sulfur protein 4, mitochondrial n=1 Tax=Dendroctonus ponderosae TaxID=77166 RepID=J3JW97_DENPD|nr:unknown [Dendroctonus ponderosae]
MASLLSKTGYIRQCCVALKGARSISTSSVLQKDAPLKDSDTLLKPEEIEHKNKLKGYITVEGPTELSLVSGIPEEQLKTRKVRIYEPPKNCMQSGTNNIGHWEMDFDAKERWENPLMGWCSTGDPLSNLKVQFATKEEAVEYCEKNGWDWYIQSSKLDRPFKPKSYAVNFAWNKRTRVSTK